MLQGVRRVACELIRIELIVIATQHAVGRHLEDPQVALPTMEFEQWIVIGTEVAGESSRAGNHLVEPPTRPRSSTSDQVGYNECALARQ